jgi:murein DD-endopeptidase MepM/ murein hydrolase activator NlpD
MAERPHILHWAGIAALCLALAACNASGRPRNAVAPKPAPAVAAAPPVNPADFGKTIGNDYIVAPGDTLSAVSDRTGTPIRSLIGMNNLQPPYALAPGMRLALKPRNGGSTPQSDAVAVPPPATPAGSVSSAPLPAPAATGAPQTLGTSAPVVSGPAVSAQSLPPFTPAAPTVTAPATATVTPSVSAPVVTPQTGVATSTIPPSPTTGAATALPKTNPTSVLPAPMPAQPSQPETTAPKPSAAPPQQPAAAAPDNDGETAAVSGPAAGSGKGPFAWPVQGKVISAFGSSKDGSKNDGINIAAPSGAPVVAAADGVVAYAGNELRGFGNMVLIRHDGGYVTAYAHNASLLVKKGDKVKRGQTIARVGATGAVFGPQLHFEIRKGTQPVDPMTFLGS